MSQGEARGAPAMPRVGQSPGKARPRFLAGTDRRRSRLSRTRQDLWEETSWSNQRWSRVAPGLRGARARSLAGGRVRKYGPCRGLWEVKAGGAEKSPLMAEPLWSL